jgi:hypothetical protein
MDLTTDPVVGLTSSSPSSPPRGGYAYLQTNVGAPNSPTWSDPIWVRDEDVTDEELARGRGSRARAREYAAERMMYTRPPRKRR